MDGLVKDDERINRIPFQKQEQETDEEQQNPTLKKIQEKLSLENQDAVLIQTREKREKKRVGSIITLLCTGILVGVLVLSGIVSLLRSDIHLPFIKQISQINISEGKLEKKIEDLEKRFPSLLSSLQVIDEIAIKTQKNTTEMIKSLSTHIREEIDSLEETINALHEKAQKGTNDTTSQSTNFQDVIIQHLNIIEAQFEEFSILQKEIPTLHSLIEKQDNNLEILKKNIQDFYKQGENITLLIAANTLKTAVNRGGSYAEELQIFSSVVLRNNTKKSNVENLNGWKLLNAYAEQGLPSAAAFSIRFAKIADEIVRTENGIPDDASIGQKLWSGIQSLIIKRPVGEVEGITTSALAARMETAISKGDYAQALDLWQKLPQLAKDVSADFVTQLRARYKIDTLLSEFISKSLVTPKRNAKK